MKNNFGGLEKVDWSHERDDEKESLCFAYEDETHKEHEITNRVSAVKRSYVNIEGKKYFLNEKLDQLSAIINEEPDFGGLIFLSEDPENKKKLMEAAGYKEDDEYKLPQGSYGLVYFRECKFPKVSFEDLKCEKLIFDNCLFSQTAKFSGIGFNSTVFRDCFFEKEANFENFHCEDLSFDKCRFSQTAKFSSKNHNSTVFRDCSFEEKINFENFHCEKLSFEDCEFKGRFRLSKEKKKKDDEIREYGSELLYPPECSWLGSDNKISEFVFKQNELKNEGSLRIGRTNFEKFSIENLKNEGGEINIGEITAENFEIVNLRNFGNLVPH